MARTTTFLRGMAFVSLLAGCTAELTSAPGQQGAGAGSGAGGGVRLDDLENVDPETLADGVAFASRVPRLSYLEYDRSVSSLLGTNVQPSALFPAEQPNLGPFDSGASRTFNERLLQEVVLAAERLAAEAVADEPRYLALVGCSPTAADCRDAFLQRFGRRAYRRPLSDAEFARFRALFDGGADLIASGDAFRDGVQLVVEATLQSAKFLYRAERGSGLSDDVGPLLDGFEVATRLSFLFWGEGPDDALLDAAADGRLATPEGIAEQAERLAADARLRDRLHDFHERWFQMDGLAAAEKDVATYPNFGPALVASMRAETTAFFDEILLARNGAVVELLTSRFGAVDANLAGVYGLEGSFGTTPSPFEFPPEAPRAGLLTRAAFLTGHSSAATRTSPILRGVFVLDRLLCQHVPPPPAGAEMQEPETEPETPIQTTRDYFAWKTSMPACAGCHSIINPVGFAFENFDGIGSYLATENGAPIVSAGELEVADSTLGFESGPDFVEQMAALPRVRSCYSLHWLNYAYGRSETSADARTLARMTQGMGDGGFGVRDLLRTITRGAAFQHLPPLEDR